MGDAQIYARTATFNADVAAFFTKWLDDVEEAQIPHGKAAGAYPDYCPYPMAHGAPGAAQFAPFGKNDAAGVAVSQWCQLDFFQHWIPRS
jgi:alpha-L-rhamnosidase